MHSLISKIKDPASAITHGIFAILITVLAIPLLYKTSQTKDMIHIISISIFTLSMIFLYTASTLYHSIHISDRIHGLLKRIDHMMIFILIAGTYTPICFIVLQRKIGLPVLLLVWGMAIIGIVLKAFFVYCPKWVSSVLYISMGWTCIFALSPIFHSLPKNAFLLLLSGGIIYTIGGVIYALKLQVFNQLHPRFGSHDIFHLFCIGGSICHFILMYQFVSCMPITP